MDYFEIGVSICLGVGLASAVGFRVFLPLLLLSLAGYYDYIPLNESWEWIGGLTALIILGLATLVEIFGYYIPWVDNLLDTLAVPMAAVAGTVVVVATIGDLNPVFTWALAIIAGGGTATAIKGNVSLLRLSSTATTGGLANPVVSTVETGGSVVMTLLSLFFPIIAIVFVIFIFYRIFRFYKKHTKK
jgi:hypothetical protein